MTDIQRVTKVVDWLKLEGIIESRRDLALKLGYTESSLSQILNGKVALSDRFIKRLSILSSLLNESWLITGEGKMLNSIDDSAPAPIPLSPAPTLSTESLLRIVESQQRTIENLSRIIENMSGKE